MSGERPSRRKFSLQGESKEQSKHMERALGRSRKQSICTVPSAPLFSSPSSHPDTATLTLQRRLSVLNPFAGSRRKSSESHASEFNEYEVVESSFSLPPNFDRVDSRAYANQLTEFFARQNIVDGVQSELGDGWADSRCNYRLGYNSSSEWSSPASWGVFQPPKAPSSKASYIENPDWSELWVIRVFRPEIRRHSMDATFPVLDNAGLMYVTVSAPFDTVVSDLYPTLARKFFGCSDIGRFRLFAEHAGLETMLPDDAQPFALQRKWLEDIGYRGRDEVNQAIVHEHSYVCRFSLKELPAAGRPGLQRSTSFSEERVVPKYALLGNMNLTVVPIDLFKYSRTLETIDFSRNTLLELPDDLFNLLVSLRLLILRQNLLDDIPPAILCVSSLTNLDLTSNRLTGLALAPLASLINLISLNLTSNQVDKLPIEFAKLSKLKSLILSSNYLESFDPIIFTLHELVELDLSFNQIGSIPDDISQLKSLQCFVLTGNALSEISICIRECRQLRVLDLRGNLLQDISCLYECYELADLRADYNYINSIISPNWPKMYDLSISRNNMCKVVLRNPLPCLRTLDLSANRIGRLSDDFFNTCSGLEYLNLTDNQLTAIPSSLEMLNRLVKLVAANNQLSELSVNFSLLKRLKILDLHGNNLKRLTSDLWMAPALAILNLSSNFFNSLPTMPTNSNNEHHPLTFTLEELYLGENQCRNEVFFQLANCKELRRLNLSMNDIYDIPIGLKAFSRLSELIISHNQLSSLPDDIDKITGLKVLLINNNRLSTLPGELCQCKELKVLDVSSNLLRYNVTNVPYDWNWRWNQELQYLNLADNSKLDIQSNNSELTSFRNMPKLRSLNVSNVRIKPELLPQETTTLRLRTSWSDISGIKVGVAEGCGRSMRFDSFDFTVGRFNSESDCLVGVFDGKGSANVSNYLYSYFPSNLHSALSSDSVEDALRLALLASNADLSTQPIELRAGSTATILYMIKSQGVDPNTVIQSSTNAIKLYVANVGDTVAVLSREGRALELTDRHYAWSRTEMDRLRALGGYISMNGLVEGEVELTRAVGYLHMLPFINAAPSIRSIDVTEQDEFVVVGTGALWRVINYQTAVDIVRKDPSDLPLAAQRIRDLALTYSPEDSFMVLVLGLSSRRQDSIDDAKLDTKHSESRRRHREEVQDSILARLPREIDPPTGTIAMVFTDIKDSTVLWETATAAMRVAKKMHHMIMRRLLRTIGGYEVKTEGDAFMVSFESVGKAVRWTLAVQVELLNADWPPELLTSSVCGEVHDVGGNTLYRGLSVRMGIHYGEMEGEQDIVTGRMDYNGIPVIIASRIQSLALGGQILVSAAVRNQLAFSVENEDTKSINTSAQFIDCGWVRLKGIEAREHVFALYPGHLAKRYVGPLVGAVTSPHEDGSSAGGKGGINSENGRSNSSRKKP